MFLFPKKADKKETPEQKRDDVFSDVWFGSTTLRMIEYLKPERPEKPEWYDVTWEICYSGQSIDKYSIKRDGLLVKATVLSLDTFPATFRSLNEARSAMYYLIDRDIRTLDAARRKDETVETWP